MKESSTLLGEAYHQDMYESRDILQKIKQLEGTANKIQCYIGNYMEQFETILKFVQATRQRDLLLHLQSLESLIAHHHLN